MIGDIFSFPAKDSQRTFFLCCTVYIFNVSVFPGCLSLQLSGESLCLIKESFCFPVWHDVGIRCVGVDKCK